MKNTTFTPKKIAALALAGTLAFSAVGVSAFAAENISSVETSVSDSCSDSDGFLTFSVNGESITTSISYTGIENGLMYFESASLNSDDAISSILSAPTGSTFTFTDGLGKTYHLTVAEGKTRVWIRLLDQHAHYHTLYANWVEE